MRHELLLVLHLYERIPFGQQHKGNAEVVALAARLSRTPSSVAMKLNNMTALDADERARGVAGLAGASALDRTVWQEFHEQPATVEEAEQLWLDDSANPTWPAPESPARDPVWSGATEALALRKIRLAQRYFRRVVLANFDQRCAVTGIADPALLTASHIVGWAEAPALRVAVSNGLCLNRLHDGAFDEHLITFDENLRLVIGRRLRDSLPRERLMTGFLAYEGQALRQPVRRPIAPDLLERHRREFLRAEGAQNRRARGRSPLAPTAPGRA